jgi:glycosyltransferase involved in cell wall biosynthesis
MPLISAAICTHNDAAVVPDAIESLLGQSLAEDQVDLLVIDNASTDTTPEVLTDISSRYPDRVRVVREAEPGLSAARNRALREARAPWLAYIDADAIADVGWLAGLADAIDDDDRVAVVGGPIEVKWDHPVPSWWDERIGEALNAFRLGDEKTRMRYPQYPYGTNIAVRVAAAQAVGGFAARLGRKGRSLAAAEEGELCLRLENAGWRVLYTPDAVVHHRTAAERLTRRYVLRRAFHHGRSQFRVESWHGLRSEEYLTWPAILSRVATHLLRGRCDLPFLKYIGFRVGYNLERVLTRA